MPGNILPLNLNQTLQWKVRNFPDDVYNFNPTDNLTILMSILLGNAGVGQLELAQLAARLNQQNLEFSDIDNILGQLLDSPRLVSEIYSESTNPFIDQLVTSSWDDVLTKDSSYRERLIGVAHSLLRGATVAGLQDIAESTSGFRFNVIECWNTIAATSGTATTLGTDIVTRGFGSNEIVLIPHLLPDITLTEDTIHAIYNSARDLKPAGSIVTVAEGFPWATQMVYSGTLVSGNSSYFSLDREVTGNGINVPSYVNSNSDISIKGRYWLPNNQVTLAPQFAHLRTQEFNIDVTENITSATVTAVNSTISVVPTTTTEPLGVSSLSITSTCYGAQ